MTLPGFLSRLRLPQGAQPLVILACLSGVAFFGMLTDEMMEGDTRVLDSAILRALRTAADASVPLGPAWLPQTAVDITALGGFTVLWLLSASVVGFLLIIGKRTDAALLAFSVGGASMINWGLKLLVGRDRPEVVPHLVQVSNASYPSGHAMLAAATYLTVAAMLARAQPRRRARVYLLALAVLLVVLIGVSRLYLGVHWPSDVLGGWCLGSAWALAGWIALRAMNAPTRGS